MVPEGVWPGIIKSAELRVARETKYIQVRVGTVHGDVWVNLVTMSQARWRYKAQLEALGVELNLYYEWDGVDLVEQMTKTLALVLPDRWCYVAVMHREFRGRSFAQAELVKED